MTQDVMYNGGTCNMRYLWPWASEGNPESPHNNCTPRHIKKYMYSIDYSV